MIWLLLVPVFGLLGYEGYGYYKATKGGPSQAPSPGAAQLQTQSAQVSMPPAQPPVAAQVGPLRFPINIIERPSLGVAHATTTTPTMVHLRGIFGAQVRGLVQIILNSLPPVDPSDVAASIQRQVTVQALNSLAATPTVPNLNSTIAILQRPANGAEANAVAQKLTTIVPKS